MSHLLYVWGACMSHLLYMNKLNFKLHYRVYKKWTSTKFWRPISSGIPHCTCHQQGEGTLLYHGCTTLVPYLPQLTCHPLIFISHYTSFLQFITSNYYKYSVGHPSHLFPSPSPSLLMSSTPPPPLRYTSKSTQQWMHILFSPFQREIFVTGRLDLLRYTYHMINKQQCLGSSIIGRHGLLAYVCCSWILRMIKDVQYLCSV